MKYCSKCGQALELRVPPGDHMQRHICTVCGEIHYQNPRMIVGCLPVHEDRILLCRRAIDPCLGLWTLPAGFMENGETVEEGAMRETREEANARVEIVRLQTVYSIPRINQVYLLFLGRLTDLDFSPGPESQETQLFSHDGLPWDEIAFSAVRFCLQTYIADGIAPVRGETHLGLCE